MTDCRPVTQVNTGEGGVFMRFGQTSGRSFAVRAWRGVTPPAAALASYNA